MDVCSNVPTKFLTVAKDKASKTQKNLNTRVLDTWTVEIIAASFSLACFAAICGVLIAYDTKPTPNLRYGLTLNAVISILATGCKSSLLFTVGESISQAKWSWFTCGAPKPLVHIQTIDSASRGPSGSFMMLFNKRMSFASFGAVIIILFLAFDPFIQQIVKYPTRLAATSESSAVTKRLTCFTPLLSTTEWDLAYESGIWSDDNEFHPNCPSGNCDWPRFKSLGICSQCVDMMESASLDCQRLPQDNKTFSSNQDGQDLAQTFNSSCQINLPFGESANFTVQSSTAEDPRLNSVSSITFPRHLTWGVHGFETLSSPYPGNLTFAGLLNPLLVLASANMQYNSTRILPEDPTQGLKIRNITECSLALCLADHDVSVSQGKVKTNVSGVDFGHSFSRNFTSLESETPLRYTTYAHACWRPSNAPPNVSFEISDQIPGAPGAMLSSVEFEICNLIFELPSRDSFEGSDAVIKTYREDGTWQEVSYLRTWETRKGPYAVDSPTQRIASVGLEAIMANISSTLSKAVLQVSGEDVNGTAYSIQTVVEVQWPWLILPVLLLLSGLCFFILTIFSSKKHRVPLWKSSVLALMYHGLDDDAVDSHDHSTASKMESRAEMTCVQLQMSDERGDFTLTRKPFPSQVKE